MDSGDEDRKSQTADSKMGSFRSQTSIGSASSGSPLVRGSGAGGSRSRQTKSHLAPIDKTSGPSKLASEKSAEASHQPTSDHHEKSFGYNLAKSIAFKAHRFNDSWSTHKMSYLNLVCLLMTLACLITILLFSNSGNSISGNIPSEMAASTASRSDLLADDASLDPTKSADSIAAKLARVSTRKRQQQQQQALFEENSSDSSGNGPSDLTSSDEPQQSADNNNSNNNEDFFGMDDSPSDDFDLSPSTAPVRTPQWSQPDKVKFRHRKMPDFSHDTDQPPLSLRRFLREREVEDNPQPIKFHIHSAESNPLASELDPILGQLFRGSIGSIFRDLKEAASPSSDDSNSTATNSADNKGKVNVESRLTNNGAIIRISASYSNVTSNSLPSVLERLIPSLVQSTTSGAESSMSRAQPMSFFSSAHRSPMFMDPFGPFRSALSLPAAFKFTQMLQDDNEKSNKTKAALNETLSAQASQQQSTINNSTGSESTNKLLAATKSLPPASSSSLLPFPFVRFASRFGSPFAGPLAPPQSSGSMLIFSSGNLLDDNISDAMSPPMPPMLPFLHPHHSHHHSHHPHGPFLAKPNFIPDSDPKDAVNPLLKAILSNVISDLESQRKGGPPGSSLSKEDEDSGHESRWDAERTLSKHMKARHRDDDLIDMNENPFDSSAFLGESIHQTIRGPGVTVERIIEVPPKVQTVPPGVKSQSLSSRMDDDDSNGNTNEMNMPPKHHMLSFGPRSMTFSNHRLASIDRADDLFPPVASINRILSDISRSQSLSESGRWPLPRQPFMMSRRPMPESISNRADDHKADVDSSELNEDDDFITMSRDEEQPIKRNSEASIMTSPTRPAMVPFLPLGPLGFRITATRSALPKGQATGVSDEVKKENKRQEKVDVNSSKPTIPLESVRQIVHEDPFTSPSSPLFGFPSSSIVRDVNTAEDNSSSKAESLQSSAVDHLVGHRQPRGFTYHSNNKIASAFDPKHASFQARDASSSANVETLPKLASLGPPAGFIMGRRLDDGPDSEVDARSSSDKMSDGFQKLKLD